MRLYKEIFGGEGDELFSAARCVLLPLKEGYFEGVKALGDFSDTLVEVCYKDCTLRIAGEGLEIAKFCDGDLKIAGKILSIAVEEVRK
ncbi:MAG: YabP/YqfC family sporulation protein [Clostridia bacterium]|nr:YabP/YqfC family sporulation protein [Clostridia bacterium]